MPKKKKKARQTVDNLLDTEANQALFNEIAFLKKRIHLVEGERKANYESNEEIQRNNEAKLQDCKSVNAQLKKKHRNILQTSNNFFFIVSRRLGNEREAYAFRGKTCNQTIDILECRIGDYNNKLNLLRFKKSQLKVKMDEIIKKEEKFRETLDEARITKENASEMQLKNIENETALMQMKIIEAENIRARYKSMIDALKNENYRKEIKIAEMTKLIDQQSKETERLQGVLQEAQKARKIARTKLTEVESETIREYTEREQELFESRLKLKQIRDKMDAIGAKLTFPKFHMIHRDSSISEGLYQGIQATTQGEARPQSMVEIVYNRLSEMTGEADPEIIVQRFYAQREHAKILETEEADVKAEVRRSKVRKKFLSDKLNQLQYSGGLRRETLDERSHLITQEKDATDLHRFEVDKEVFTYSTTMHEMLAKLHEICNKNEIKIPHVAVAITPSPSERFVGDKVVSILKYILIKLEHILEDQDKFSPTYDGDNLSASDNEVSVASTVLKSNGLIKSFEDSTLRRLSTNEEGSTTNTRRLSIIDVISNEGDIVGRNIMAVSEPLAELEDMGIVPGSALDKRDDSQIHSSRKSDTSDEEEAVTRATIKRQSQILVEAKTRKGRFNPAMTMPTRRRV